jgi:glycosyltransferase involved in cell wall biosynthesis
LTRIINDRLRSATRSADAPPGKANQVEALAAAMRALLGDENRRNAMGRRGFAMVRERFTWRAVALRYLQIYAASV